MKEEGKNYDGWNNSIEKRMFDNELKKDVILRLCQVLKCDIGDVVEIMEDKK